MSRHSESPVGEFYLRLEKDGVLLGEWPLEDADLTLAVRDAQTGRAVLGVRLAGGDLAQRALRPTHDELPLFDADADKLRSPGDDFTMPIPEPSASILTGELPTAVPHLPAFHEEVSGVTAEVWSRREGRWVLRGSLRPGQRARMGEGMVGFDAQGRLLVTAGKRLEGNATLPDGSRLKIESGSDLIRLPSGSAVNLSAGSSGFFVRSGLQEPPPVEHTGSSKGGRGMGFAPLVSDLEGGV